MSQTTAQLEALMAQANIADLVQLGKQSGVALRQIYRLQKGLIHTLPVEEIVRLAQFFDLAVDEFLALFLPYAIHPIAFTAATKTVPTVDPAELTALQQEGDRLRVQLKEEAEAFAEMVQTLEHKLASQAADHQHIVAALQTEQDNLHAQLTAANTTHAEMVKLLETQIAEQTQELELLQSQLTNQSDTPAIDPAEWEALQTEGDRLRTQLAAQAQELADLQAQLDEYTDSPQIDPTELEALQLEGDRLRAELKVETEAHAQSVTNLEARLAAQATEHAKTVETLKAEYSRLENQLTGQGDTNQQQWQQEALDILESWLLQWSAAANAAQNNPSFPAKTLVALAQPFEQLLEHWGVTPIGAIGERVAYDPKQHQLVKGGFDVKPGDPVRVQNVGYQQGDRLLHRAKVISSLNGDSK